MTMRIQTTFEGGLAANPRAGRTHEGSTWANFRIGVDHERFDRATGAYEKYATSWFEVNTYGVLADNVISSLRKGDRVIVSGTLELEKWDNGEKSGTSAKLKATAVGHNLKFGITKMIRNKDFTPTTEAAEPEVQDEDSGAWGALPDSPREGASASETGGATITVDRTGSEAAEGARAGAGVPAGVGAEAGTGTPVSAASAVAAGSSSHDAPPF